MSEKLNTEQIEAVAGGIDTCSAVDTLGRVPGMLPGVYETLIDFTSQVIERVATSLVK